MLQLMSGNFFIVILTLVFVAIFLTLEALYLLWNSYRGPNSKKIEQRLNAISASLDNTRQAQLLKQRMLSEVPIIERFLINLPKAQRLQKVIHQAGLNWTVARLVLSCGALGVASYMIITAIARQSVLSGTVAGMAISALPWLYVQYRRNRRLKKIESQLPDALDLLTRALRSGHAFSSGLQMLGEEMPEPIASEFRIVHDEINFGISLGQALINLTERVPITDLRYFAVSVLIQRESGGNLTEVLSNLSRLIRDRLKLLSKIKVLSAEGRMSAWILVSMPFALAAFMNIFNPKFMSPLWTDPMGISMVKYMLGLMAVGVIMLIKIIKIRV